MHSSSNATIQVGGMMNTHNWLRYLLLGMLGLFISAAANAGEIGTLINLVGKAAVIRADGSTQPCKPNDKINEGDVVETEKGAFAQLKLIDGGEMILRQIRRFVLISTRL